MKVNKNIFKVEVNKIKTVDAGDGLVKFSKPLTITDNTEQLNGTKYDIETMDISEYKGLVTIDHGFSIKDIVAKVVGIAKTKSKVVIEGLEFAIKENAVAQFAKNMLVNGFVTDFSIETIGPWPNDEGIYKNSKLVGLSMVIVGNNKSATVNEIVKNSISQAKEAGLDTSELEKNYPLDKIQEEVHNDVMKYITVTNSRKFEVQITFVNASDKEVTINLAPGATYDIREDQKEAVEKQINEAVEAKKEVDVVEAVKNAVAPLNKKLADLEQKVFDNKAKEPEFVKQEAKKITGELSAMDYRERHGKQINYAWDALKGGNSEAMKKLNDINKFHVELLKEKGVVPNSVSLADFGNFVISPELLKDITGHRSDFSNLLSRLDFKETLSLQMAWLKRSGDINMQEVSQEPGVGGDGNLKPLSEYGATIETSNLHELAAVTPVVNSATRFLAADLLGDVAAGYRTDYDRKRAQLFIARLQQAVNSTGNEVTYAVDTDLNSLKSWISTWVEAQEEIMNGTFIFNQKTYGKLLSAAVGAGISGPLAGLFTTGDQPLIAGAPYIVVPNELLPTVGEGDTKTFTVEGTAVTITKGVFYVDLSTFTGRTSGGLNYDLSTEAAYEDNGEVKSAFQRNELVLRGSFFRGGAIRDEDKVVGMGDAGLS